MAPEPPGVTEEEKAALVGQILRGELTPSEACRSAGLSDLELKQWVRAYARAARRAVDHQVAEALAAHGLPVDESGPPEFLGNLDSMSVADLIQTVQFGKKDAQIRIDHMGEQSQLWCMEGEVVDAATARLSGAPAVYRVLSLTHGRVHADFAPVQRPRTIHASTQALLLEAAKRADECAQIRERLGDTLNIYLVSPSAPPLAEVEPDQAQVLAAFDGTRSVEEVVRESEFPDLETLAMIARLVEQEWLMLKPFALQKREARSSLVPAAPLEGSFMPLEGSFMPLAASLPTATNAARARLEEPRIRLWASAVAGVAVVGIAFVVGFYSARSSDPTRRAAAQMAHTAQTTRPAATCPAGTTRLAGPQCLDLAAVTAGDYRACVRAGACEPAQREFDSGAEQALAQGMVGGVAQEADRRAHQGLAQGAQASQGLASGGDRGLVQGAHQAGQGLASGGDRGLVQGADRGLAQGADQGLAQGAQGADQGLAQGATQGAHQGLASGASNPANGGPSGAFSNEGVAASGVGTGASNGTGVSNGAMGASNGTGASTGTGTGANPAGTNGGGMGGPNGTGASNGAWTGGPNLAGTGAPNGVPPASVTAVASMTTPSPPTPEAANTPGSTASDASRRSDRTARCNAGLSGRESYPVNCLTFQQARRYCEWRGGRLPTRAEWELAATSGRVPPLADLSEWTVEPPPPGITGGREHSVVLGGESGAFARISRLASSANAQGKSVGFRCTMQLDETAPPRAAQARSTPPAP